MNPIANPEIRRAANVGGLTLLAVAVLSMAIVAFPQAIGANHSYVVVSGSMNPTIDAGDVVIVRDVAPEFIESGDVITFQREQDSVPTTHRVVEVIHADGEPQFQTQGDANEEPDQQLVSAGEVTGAVWFHIPLVGHLLSFAQSKLGILALIIVPAVLLVISESHSLLGVVNESKEEGTETPDEIESEPVEGTR
ncbi:signal peptidase I [Haladaptatus cibarius]|uniref:signal peptidase I n=1 Tax=Haladaptatus cibarius TaxID=453847 RepID=UPI0006786C9A|nr:signal peptidase I [Haladaptatus cibarius]